MSASLVGSEMCIRDRASPKLRHIMTSREAREPGQSLQDSLRHANTRSCRCLLYTSDAADDM
eukprot:707294-Alexandrium_andersonii.AAC.1